MLTIRLQRVGRKNDPSFRVVVVESKRKPQTGNYLEMLGSYDPRVDTVRLKNDRIKHWLRMGATTSETVHNILINAKLIEGKKINVLPRKSPPKKDLPADAGQAESETIAASTPEEKSEAPREEAAPAPASEPAEANAAASGAAEE